MIELLDIYSSPTLVATLNQAIKDVHLYYCRLRSAELTADEQDDIERQFQLACEFIRTCERFNALRYGQMCSAKHIHDTTANTTTKEQ